MIVSGLFAIFNVDAVAVAAAAAVSIFPHHLCTAKSGMTLVNDVEENYYDISFSSAFVDLLCLKWFPFYFIILLFRFRFHCSLPQYTIVALVRCFCASMRATLRCHEHWMFIWFSYSLVIELNSVRFSSLWSSFLPFNCCWSLFVSLFWSGVKLMAFPLCWNTPAASVQKRKKKTIFALTT